MAFTRPDGDRKIWRGKPDVITGQAETVKADFDRLLNENTADLNGLITELEAGTAAASLGCGEGTVQAALANRLAKDNETPYTPTAEYHPATKGYVDGIALEAGVVLSVFGRAGAVTAQAGDYTAEMVGAAPASHSHAASDIGAAPEGHTHPLSQVTDAGTAAKKDAVTSVASAGEGLPTSGAVYSYVTGLMGRTTGVSAADTSYGTVMSRGIKAGTSDLTAGSSSLTSGVIYVVYE